MNQSLFILCILITYHTSEIEIKFTWFMMTPMNKCYIEIIYWTFIEFELKTYYLDSHKCYSKCQNKTKSFNINIESNTC